MSQLWSKLKKGKTANVGDVAPEFTMNGTQGDVVNLSDYRGKQRVLMVFYPQDCTSTCTDQLAAIGETQDDFTALDTVPFGVNDGDAASHQVFIDQLGIDFDLLVDEGLAVATAYDAIKPEGDRILRTVFVVGKDGKIIFRAQGVPPPSEMLLAISNANDE